MNRFDTPLDHGPVRLRLGALAGVAGIVAAAVRVLAATHFDEQHVPRAIAWAGAHPAMVFVVNLAELLAFGLIAFCCLTLTGLVRGRGKVLTQLGGWGTGITWAAIALNSSGVLIASLGDYRDPAAGAAVVTHFMHSPQAAVLLVLVVSSALWPPLFGIGLCRARLVGWWYAALVVVWTALEVVVSGTGVLALVANIVPLAAVVGVWVHLLLQRAAHLADPAQDPAAGPLTRREIPA